MTVWVSLWCDIMLCSAVLHSTAIPHLHGATSDQYCRYSTFLRLKRSSLSRAEQDVATRDVMREWWSHKFTKQGSVALILDQGWFYVAEGGGHVPPRFTYCPPDSKASWLFWRVFWCPKILQNLNFPGLCPGPRWTLYLKNPTPVLGHSGFVSTGLRVNPLQSWQLYYW